MNFEYLDTDHTLDSEHDTNATESAGENWNRIDTFKLIALFKEHHDYYRTVDSKTMFWKFIQEQLQKQCIVRSIKSIRTKWSNLIRTYKAVLRNQPNNKNPKKFVFFAELDEILKDEPFGSQNAQISEESNPIEDTFLKCDSDNKDDIILQYVNEESSASSQYNQYINRKKSSWKRDYYRSKISDLEDRRQFRERKLQLAINREERKLRHLQLKEKKFALAKLQFKLDKRKSMLEDKL